MDKSINAEEILTRSFRFQNRELLDNYVILAVTDTEGKIKHVSTNLCRVFGYKPSDIINESYHFLIAKDSQKIFGTQFNDAVITKATYKGEIKHASSTDNIIWADTIIEPLFDDDENHVGFVFASNDITQEKKLAKINEENLLLKNYDSTILDFMPNISAAILLKTASSLHKILWVMTLGIILFFIWAYLFEIDDVVKSEGKVIATTNIQKVSSLEGGVLQKLYVKKGDIVKRGDKLLQISDISYKSEYDKKFFTMIALKAKAERLRAQSEGREIENIKEIINFDPNLIKNEKDFYESNIKKLDTQLKILNEQIIQKTKELSENIKKQVILKKNHKILRNELNLKKDLVKNRVISKAEYLKLERNYNDVYLNLKTTEGMIPILKSSLKEIKSTKDEAFVVFRNKSKDELIQVYNNIQTIKKELNILYDKIQRASIVATEDGVINQINKETIGEAISPGAVIMEIIPNSNFVLVELQVSPSDIGFLYSSQLVKIKLKAYDFSLYGGILGNISYISADTILDKKTNLEYYIVHVKSDEKHIGSHKNLKIKAGMTVDADVITGKKTILNYILKPLIRTL